MNSNNSNQTIEKKQNVISRPNDLLTLNFTNIGTLLRFFVYIATTLGCNFHPSPLPCLWSCVLYRVDQSVNTTDYTQCSLVPSPAKKCHRYPVLSRPRTARHCRDNQQNNGSHLYNVNVTECL